MPPRPSLASSSSRSAHSRWAVVAVEEACACEEGLWEEEGGGRGGAGGAEGATKVVRIVDAGRQGNDRVLNLLIGNLTEQMS